MRLFHLCINSHNYNTVFSLLMAPPFKINAPNFSVSPSLHLTISGTSHSHNNHTSNEDLTRSRYELFSDDDSLVKYAFTFNYRFWLVDLGLCIKCVSEPTKHVSNSSPVYVCLLCTCIECFNFSFPDESYPHQHRHHRAKQQGG